MPCRKRSPAGTRPTRNRAVAAPAQNRPRSAVPAETPFSTLEVHGVPAHREKRGRGSMKPCALTQSRARCVPTATRRPRPLRAAPVSAAAVTASQLLPRWRTRFVVPSATPIAGGDREWLSRRRGRLLTGQSWYRWPKEQRTPLLYHALARAKSTFSMAIKVFVDTALPDPTLPPRVASPDTEKFICRIYY